MARRVLLLFVVLVQSFVRIDSKCTTSFATVCEQIADVSWYSKPTWDILFVKHNECNVGANKNYEALTTGIFNTTTNLEQLYIVEKVNFVEGGVFAGLSSLQYLKLWGNELKVLQKGTFANLTHLQKLDLRYNNIENLAHGVCEGSSIKEIDLSYNSLTNIQVDMLDLPTLETLKLAHNHLSFFAPKTFHSTLIDLDLRHNDIDNFQEEVLTNLINLRRLMLSHNMLKNLPSLASLESLEVLDVSHNVFETIPSGAFSNLLELKHLYLDNNRLKTLHPSVFARKLNVETLHLHRNNLTSLSGLLGEALPKLKEITIGANPWFCQCLQGIAQYVDDRRISLTMCERQHLSDGRSPICVSVQEDCEKGGQLSENVYEEFTRAADASYKCDRSDSM